ncbi:DNA (cytosine-5-)-methyltransferase [Vibrio rotiferianus]|uniref:DNA (cytosine-5-)-methyltransferase n=1 Tax=Vibrio rotiferianus TaxID=190895 RepID=UPI0003A5D3F8|nr:DNA (cytosine-5-)-methyltransferase [Vibrio rotiferianus]PIB17903.1 DNA cytosine methylase [Vibrio rotiferianus CAIM 577 = LMG 21460]
MVDKVIKLGDELYEKLHSQDRQESSQLLKLLIEIYDQKNLAIKLNELGFKTDRKSLSSWKKDPSSCSLSLSENERNYIEQNLLPSQPKHWENEQFTFIDLFAGIGGLRKGFEDIGGKCRFTSEWDDKARRTYLANHYVDKTELPYFLDEATENPEKNRDFMDITKITLSGESSVSDEDKLRHIRKHIPKHDVLLAGFPCQPFSLAGVSKKNSLGRSHGFDCETQGTLFFDVEKIIEARKPKFFVLENVKNLKSHDKGNTFAVIVRTLDRLGYWVSDISNEHDDIEQAIEIVRKRKPDPVIIDGASFLPQHRERVVLVGVRKDLSVDKSKLSLRNVQKPSVRIPLKDILCDLSEEERDKYTLTPNLWNYLYNYALKHQTQGNGFGFGLVDPNNLNTVTRTLSARYHKDGSEILINDKSLETDYLDQCKPDCINKIKNRNDYVAGQLKNYVISSPEATPAEIKRFTKTLEDKYNEEHGRYVDTTLFDPEYKTPRRLTPRECARLMGFEKPVKYRQNGDTDFNIVCADTSAYKQFGNSVIVPVFKAVAELLSPLITESIEEEQTKNEDNNIGSTAA